MITQRLADPESAFLHALAATAAKAPTSNLKTLFVTEYRQRVRERATLREISNDLADQYYKDLTHIPT